MQFLLTLLAFTPLIVANSFIYPYVSGKVFFIRIIITAALLLFSFKLFKPKFRTEISEKLRILSKNKLFLSVLAYFSVFTLSTFFAYDKIRAFAGTPERGEGFIGMFFFIVVFILFSLLFEKKHWQWFFRLSLITGLVLFIHEAANVSQGIYNLSLIGNRGFFGIYFLFIIFCIINVWQRSKANKDRFWLWFAYAMAPISVVAIFMSEKKGVILSLTAGIFAVLVYLIARSSYGIKGRKILWGIMILMITTGGLFFITRKAEVWQNIPGLNKVATASFQSQTILARKVSAGISLDAVSPAKNGFNRLLLGWGWDNYNIAWYKNYDPAMAIYEPQSLDRSHNKFLDVLAMNGMLGLLVYFSVWLFFFRQFFAKTLVSQNNINNRSLVIEAGLVFFGVAYFIQNLFTFDQISTYVPFFALLAYSVFYFRSLEPSAKQPPASSGLIIFMSYAVSIAAIIFLIFFTVIPLIQMKQFLTLGDPAKREGILTNDFIFSRYLYSGFEIRKIFITSMISSNINDADTARYLNRAISKMEEGLESANGKLYPEYLLYLAAGYNKKGNVTGDTGWYLKAEETFKKAIELAPNYQQTYFTYAESLISQGRNSEAESLVRKSLSLKADSPSAHFYLANFLIFQLKKEDAGEAMGHIRYALESDYFIMDDSNYELIGRIARYFYDKDDPEHFMELFDLLSKFNPEDAGPYYLNLYNRNADYVRSTGKLPEKFEFY
ncbi:MAG: O-antigen ligase family protein [bacterium]|nr:O-antigen ligase family protein [bacterium]